MTALEVRRTPGALWLRLNRPAAYNALDGELMADLLGRLREVSADEEVRVVVLTGTGPAFCSGADLGGADPQDNYDGDSVSAASTLVRAITGLDRPVVCGLNGVAAGVGMALAIACDLVVATASARLTLAFSRVGLMPDGGASYTLAAAVGRARAMRMALTSETLPAPDALAAGLVTHVFGDDEYAERLDRLVGDLASGPPLAFAATKEAINAATLPGLEDAFDRERTGQSVLLRSRDAAEGMRAFNQRRRPDFRGS